MRTFKQKWIATLLLVTFSWQYVVIASNGSHFVSQLLSAPFKSLSYLLSPGEAHAATPPDPNDYTINPIPINFIDISTSGSALPPLADEDGIAGVPIGFGFDFLGTTFNTITITSNGYATFSTLISSQNVPMPSAGVPNGLISPFWDDLNPALNPAGGVFYETAGTAPNRRFIVEWKDIPLDADAGSRLTFEVVLFEGTGEIQFHYLSMVDGVGATGSGLVSGSSATIGIEDAAGTTGAELSFNQDGTVSSGSAFSFTLGGNAFADGRKLGDLDVDDNVTVLDQSIITDYIINGSTLSSLALSLSDIAPHPGTGGRAFGDGNVDASDHARLFEVIMGREGLNPTLSGSDFALAAAGDSLTLSGSGFDPVAANNTVIFIDVNGVETAVAADSVDAAGTQLVVTVPSGLSSITSIRVERSGQSSNSIAFALEGAPLLLGLVPDSGSPGDTVLIRGQEFGPTPADNQVSFNGISATVNSVSAGGVFDELNVTVPAGVATGPVTVTVSGQTSNALTFTLDGPPQVAFSSPAEDGEVTALTDIVGTASDLKLVSYTLEYAPVGGTFTSFAVGTTSVTNGVLGSFDATLLANGLYQLRLRAEDASGNISSVTRNIQISGQNKPGIFTITFTDLQVPVSGIPITVNRTYDSRRRAVSDDFGHGWNLEVLTDGTYENNRKPGDGWVIQTGGGFFNWPCSISNETKGHVTEVRFSDTEFYRFAFQVNMYATGSIIAGGCLGDVEFVQTGGVPGATLQIIGSVNVFWQNGSNYLTYDIGDPRFGQVFEPTDVRLTTSDGRQFDLNLTDGLTRIGDANGNSIFISSNGVVHSSGKSINFTRDAQGRITQITDPLGNTLDYAYDANGDLIDFTDRDANTTAFTYDTRHLLIDIIDPLGNVPMRNVYDADGRLIAQIDADGNRTEIIADVANNSTQITDRLGQATTIAYNNEGKVTSATASDGATLQYTYDSRGNRLTETDGLGNTKTFTYDARDNMTSETDPLGNTTTYTYNAKDLPLSFTDAKGNVTSFGYDANDNLLSVTDANGVVTNQFAYDSSGRVTQMTALGGTSNLTYDAFGNLTRIQGPGARDVTFTYDANGRKLTETVSRTTPSGVVNETAAYTYDNNGNVLTRTDPLGNVTTYTYDGNGRAITETDPLGNTTSYEYDARGNLVKRTYADGTFEVLGYDLENRLTAETNRAGNTTFYEYDVHDRATKITYPDGSFIQYAYDPVGNLTNFVDNLGNTTTYEYSPVRNLTKVTDPLGGITAYNYNAIGARISQTDPLGNTTQFGYDESVFGGSRINSVTFADGSTQSRTYALSGLLGTSTNELGNTTTFAYDGAGRLVSVTDALGNVTNYAYDEAGNLVSQTDANGNATTFEYDANRNMTKRTLPLGMSETFAYDAAGNLVSKTDFNGDTITYTFDSMNRLTTKTLPGGATVTMTYSPTGKVLTVTDSRGVTTYTYDVRDRVTGIDNPDGTSVVYTYDTKGRRTSVQSPAGTTTYAYDAADRLITVTDPGSGVTTYTYDAAGRVANAVYPNGTETHYSYDSRGRLTSVEHKASSTGPTMTMFDYILDAVGNRTKMTETPSGRVVDYAYDSVGRVISETEGTTTTAYTYDAVGNRLTRGSETYTYDANNRMLTAGTAAFTYDSNGNLLTKTDGLDVTQYSYDSENRLVRQVAPTGTVTDFVYDDDGNRVSSTTAGATTNFVVDPLDTSGFAQVLVEMDNVGAILSEYVYGLDLLKATLAGSERFYHFDGIGSTRLLTDAAASVTDTYQFDAFGNLTALTGTTPNYYLFVGEQLDPDLMLYYLRARYMDTTAGRFMTMDPFPGSIYDPASLHKYVYAHNNPVNLIDPSGEFTLISISISLAIVGILTTIAYFKIFKPAKDIYDKLKKLFDELPRLPLNKNAKFDDLGITLASVKAAAKGKDIKKLVELGGGAVDEAYGIVDEMVNKPGLGINVIWKRNAAAWLRYLPRVNDIPGNYLSCSFNKYVQVTYSYTLIAGAATKKIPKISQISTVIGLYLSYFNFLALMGSTINEWASGSVPPQPPGPNPKCTW